jgi:hypothetical protein
MVVKSKNRATGEEQPKKSRIKVGKLEVSKETVKNLTGKEKRQVKGGEGIVQATRRGC